MSYPFQETRNKEILSCGGCSDNGVTRQQSKNGRKKRTKSKGSVAKQLLERTTTTSRRNSERSLPIKSARTVAKVGRRRVTYAASGATDAASDKEAEKSDTEVDDDDNTEQGSSSDGAEDSLTLADVKKGLDEKGKHEETFTGSDDAVTANVALAKNKGGRKTTTKKEKSPSIDATAVDSDVSSGDTLVIKTNVENSDEEKKAPDTTCTELVDECVDIESRVTRFSAEEEKPANVPLLKLMEESLYICNGSETTISDEPTSHIGGRGDSPILETKSGKDALVENGAESETTTRSVDISYLENDVTSAEAKQPLQIEANNADESQSALEEEVNGTALAAPQTNKTTEESEQVTGKTAVAPLASIPTPDDADRANDTENECAHGDANLPGEERNNEAAPAKEQTQTDDDTEQDIAEVACSEIRTEILR